MPLSNSLDRVFRYRDEDGNVHICFPPLTIIAGVEESYDPAGSQFGNPYVSFPSTGSTGGSSGSMSEGGIYGGGNSASAHTSYVGYGNVISEEFDKTNVEENEGVADERTISKPTVKDVSKNQAELATRRLVFTAQRSTNIFKRAKENGLEVKPGVGLELGDNISYTFKSVTKAFQSYGLKNSPTITSGNSDAKPSAYRSKNSFHPIGRAIDIGFNSFRSGIPDVKVGNDPAKPDEYWDSTTRRSAMVEVAKLIAKFAQEAEPKINVRIYVEYFFDPANDHIHIEVPPDLKTPEVLIYDRRVVPKKFKSIELNLTRILEEFSVDDVGLIGYADIEILLPRILPEPLKTVGQAKIDFSFRNMNEKDPIGGKINWIVSPANIETNVNDSIKYAQENASVAVAALRFAKEIIELANPNNKMLADLKLKLAFLDSEIERFSESYSGEETI